MAKQASLFTEEWFINRGYISDGKGGWGPPPIKSNYIRSLKGDKIEIIKSKYPLTYDVTKFDKIIPKQKVNNSPDFEVKLITEWFIPYQTPSKKNARITMVKNGKIINIPSNKYREYVKVTKMYWEAFGKEFKNTVDKLELQFPLNIEMTFVRKTNQLVDYFGPGESVFDLMTDFKWWKDDNRFYGKPFFGDMIKDKNNPGVKIKILL